MLLFALQSKVQVLMTELSDLKSQLVQQEVGLLLRGKPFFHVFYFFVRYALHPLANHIGSSTKFQ